LCIEKWLWEIDFTDAHSVSAAPARLFFTTAAWRLAVQQPCLPHTPTTEAAMDFHNFDQRSYPTVSVITGYGAWAETYEDSVPDQLDIRILDQIQSVAWREFKACLDLACGTGRTGAWLGRQGVSKIEGIDITPEMIKLADAKQMYEKISCASVESTGLAPHSYDLIVMSLVDEHLPSLGPVYEEAARLSKSEAKFVVVGMHPFFFMTGMPTHFKNKDGNPTAIETHIHLTSDHFRAATVAGWHLREMQEGVIDDEWIRVKPKWAKFRNYPVNFGFVWNRS
jgi:SAM-dependent methyltransferase